MSVLVIVKVTKYCNDQFRHETSCYETTKLEKIYKIKKDIY